MTSLAPAVAAFVLVFAGLFGLVIGSFLNVVVYRVPAGIPLTRESRCGHCAAPVRAWQNVPVASWLALRARCASCAAPISARYPLVELATALAFVLVTWTAVDAWAGMQSPAVVTVTVAYLYLAAISIVLTLVDLDTRRLPNAIVLPGYVVLGVLFTLACVFGAPWELLLRSAIGGAGLFAFYLLLRALGRGGMGGGDVKLAGVLGLALGWIGWGALLVGAFAAFLLGGAYGVILMITRRAGRTSAIPFGPWMIAGVWVGIFTGDAVSQWYIGMLIAG